MKKENPSSVKVLRVSNTNASKKRKAHNHSWYCVLGSLTQSRQKSSRFPLALTSYFYISMYYLKLATQILQQSTGTGKRTAVNAAIYQKVRNFLFQLAASKRGGGGKAEERKVLGKHSSQLLFSCSL